MFIDDISEICNYLQAMVVPVGPPYNDYATEVAATIRYIQYRYSRNGSQRMACEVFLVTNKHCFEFVFALDGFRSSLNLKIDPNGLL